MDESLDVLKDKRFKGGKLNKKQNFRLLASKAARFYYLLWSWSSLELGFKEILARYDIKENRDYLHNHKIPNGLERGEFELDFYFPTLRIGVELNPKIWHIKLGNTEAKDARKWIQMEKQGIMPLFIDNISGKSLVELARKIAKLLRVEYQYFREYWSQIYKEE